MSSYIFGEKVTQSGGQVNFSAKKYHVPDAKNMIKKPPKNGEDSGGQKINNMKHKTAAKVNKKPSTPQGYGGKKL